MQPLDPATEDLVITVCIESNYYYMHLKTSDVTNKQKGLLSGAWL